MPPGGPFDRLSAALANALVGIDGEASILEITLGPVAFEAEAAVLVAVVGGPDGAFPLAPGERIEVRPVGARAYIASVRLAPHPLPPLPQRGEGNRFLANPPRLGETPFRVLPGPQSTLLDFDRFLAGSYTIGNASNRVGVRLEGLKNSHALSLPSEPAIPGVVQVPPGGEPIVLGPDGPTIGGYPKVAVVIDADLDRLGRARPGDALRFRLVSPDEARRAGAEARRERGRRCAELRLAALLDG